MRLALHNTSRASLSYLSSFFRPHNSAPLEFHFSHNYESYYECNIKGRILGFNAKSDYHIDSLKYQLSGMECILNSIYKKKIIDPSSDASSLRSLATGLPHIDFPSSTILLAPQHITLQRSTCNKVYDLIHAVSKGVVADWDALEEVWQHAVTVAGKVAGKFVIFGDSILGSDAQRNKIKETLITKYSASDCLVIIAEEIVFFEYFFKTPVSAAVVVLFSGDCIHVTPVHEGRALASSSVLIDFGEELLFRHFKNLWEEETSAVDSDAFVYGLFEKAAVFARDDEHRNMLSETSLEVLVPDIITVGYEILFPFLLFSMSMA